MPCKIIAAQFAEHTLGVVSRIEWTENYAYPKYKQCFVYLISTNSKNAAKMMVQLVNPKGFRLYYSSTRFWKVFLNNSSIAAAPTNVHMDIQITVPTGTNIEFVYERLDAECIGKIAGHYLAPACAKDTNKVIIGIVFEYWYRNEPAIALQQALLDTEFVDLTVFRDICEPTQHCITEIDDCIENIVQVKEMWRVHQSIYAPILPGVSPFIWINSKKA